MTSEPLDLVGRRFGRYRVHGKLGEGGMGVVYQAKDEVLGRHVALKVISSVVGADDERRRRFAREARAAAAFNHPNAVAIFDAGEIEGVAFIAMELVEGKTLRGFIGAADLGLAERIRWLADVARALAAAHRLRIIHRDIKPENVMVRDDGQVKVLDFGVARFAELTADPQANTIDAGLPQLTQDDMRLGTPLYMAPEQLQGEPFDARADQFSWGVMAYELLAGRSPWKGEALQVGVQILMTTPPPLHTLCPEILPSVEATIARAMAKAKEDRFPSMDEVVAALALHTAEPAGSAFPSTLRPPAREPVTLGETPNPPAQPVTPSSSSGPDTPPSGPDPLSPPSPKSELSSSSEPARTLPSEGSDAARSRSGSTTPPAREPEPALSASGSSRPGSASMSSRAAPLARLRWPLALVAAGAIGAFGLMRLSPWPDKRAPQRSAQVISPAPAGPRPPAPPGSASLPAAKPEALAALQAGIKAFREDSTGAAIAELDRAAALDPALAPAAGLRVVAIRAIDTIDAPTRERFREVERRRAEFGERDRMLLDAFEPLVRRQPADYREASLRFEAAVQRFPSDAELWFSLAAYGTMGTSAGGTNLAGAIPPLKKALELDPAFIPALMVLGQYQAYTGAFDEAHRTFDRCLELSSASALCMNEVSAILEEEGACDRMESMARRLIAAAPGESMGYANLAKALAGRRPTPAVLEALKQKWSAVARQGPGPSLDGGSGASPVELADRALLAMLSGDFEAAERHVRALEGIVASSPSQEEHGRPARWLAQTLLETGRQREAGRVSEAFLSRRDAWEPDARAEDYAMAADVTPALLRTLLAEGRLPRAEIESRRSEWVKAWEAKVIPSSRSFVWLHGHAGVVEDAATAKAALLALPAYAPIPPYHPRTLAAEGIGLTYLLSRHLEEARLWLTRATRTCRALDFPVEHTRAHYWLGQAREELHDPTACEAYAVVVRRWGEATPPSLTARKAQGRMKALGCNK